ncbi:MAG: tRNA glutamyl-Q(34) synthetase GluQRS [Caulobacterales bacterium]|nr:tRNA glutamyl-Q(34) synthetase GluQRS [Caulobacterales bacterium]
MASFVTRFAPSPTGLLHLGHAYAALRAFDAAKEANGRFLLRIEDIDAGRRRPEFEAAIFEDLAWLGLVWETPVRRQSEHVADYAGVLARLREMGVVYRCFKTRKEVLEEMARAPHHIGEGPDGRVYRGPERPLRAEEEEALLAEGRAFAWRLSLARCRARLGGAFDRLVFVEEWEGPAGETGDISARPDLLGDVVLARKDAGTSYHLASVHDDAAQGVTHVVRGRDLFHASHLHRLLQELLGLPVPRYRHHRLILGPDGKRLAKRDRAATLQARRDAGAAPQELRELLGL